MFQTRDHGLIPGTNVYAPLQPDSSIGVTTVVEGRL